MASISDNNNTFDSGDKRRGSESNNNAKLSEAEQYADDLARQLIKDTGRAVSKEHSGLMDFSTELIETAPALTGTDHSISEQPPPRDEPKADLVDDKQNLLSLSQSPAKPSAIIANTPLYFEEDSLAPLSSGNIVEIDELPKESEEVKKEEAAAPATKEEEEKEEKQEELVKAQQPETEVKTGPREVERRETEGDEGQEKENQQPQETREIDEENNQLDEEEPPVRAMEFTKNYSDDLLMDQRTGESEPRPSGTASDDIVGGTGGPDLADFELPPYSGSSSSGSEQAAGTTTATSSNKQKPSSSQSRKYSSSTSAAASSVAVPDLTALKKLLLSSYSQVSHVFHWKNPIESGIFFATGLTVIIALTFFSIISVVAYGALGIILTSGLIRLYKSAMKTLNRPSATPVDHIWEQVLSLNVSMSSEKMHELVDTSHANVNASLVYIKQVLLVEDKLATFKFGFILYLLTYIGAWFNGLTLITICYLSLFSVPLVYEKNKTKIDEYLNLATSQIYSTISTITNKVTALAFGSSSGDAKKQN